MKKAIQVSQDVEVTVPDGFFTPEFMAEFRKDFYDFDSVDDHYEHLAQLHARGLAGDESFIEGYGYAPDIGIKFVHVGTTTSVEEGS